MSSVAEYVAARFGDKEAQKLANIRQGGDNNQKGGQYENYYAVYRGCAIAANDPESRELNAHVISSQDLAFVDDLCIKGLGLKTNYQAKNSAGAAADWTADTTRRFQMQSEIDRDVHGFDQNKQILLVSCPAKAQQNKGKIPEELAHFSDTEYFPYCETPSLLIQTYEPLRVAMAGVCADTNLSTLDAAFKLVLAAWATSGGKELTVEDLFTEAKSLSKPNVFKVGVDEAVVPEWLERLCTSFVGCAIRVESGNFKISYKGLDVRCDAQLLEKKPEEQTLASITTPMELIHWVMKAMEGGLS